MGDNLMLKIYLRRYLKKKLHLKKKEINPISYHENLQTFSSILSNVGVQPQITWQTDVRTKVLSKIK
jgi:hypothetical protein